MNIEFIRGTHIEANNTVQASEGLDDDLPHVEESVLEKLLYGNLLAVVGPDLELWGKCITSPETGPVDSTERRDSDKTKGGLRQSGSSKLLVTAGPHTPFCFYVTASPDTLQPSRPRLFKGVQVKSNGFKSPGWSA